MINNLLFIAIFLIYALGCKPDYRNNLASKTAHVSSAQKLDKYDEYQKLLLINGFITIDGTNNKGWYNSVNNKLIAVMLGTTYNDGSYNGMVDPKNWTTC